MVYVSQCSFAVKRHHDYATSYERRPLIVAGLQFHFQGCSPLSAWREHHSMETGTVVE